MTYLVVIVPPEDVNGDAAHLPNITDAIEKAFVDHGLAVHIEVVKLWKTTV